MSIAGLVLAGGRSSRMCGDAPKSLLKLGGRTLVGHVLASFTREVDPVLISTNDPGAFASLGLPLVLDRSPGFAGPLAGLDAAAGWLGANRADVTHVLALPGDTPFLPLGLAETMSRQPGTDVRVARRRGRLHPTVALWPVIVLRRLPGHFATAGSLSILRFLDTTGFVAVDFDGAPDEAGIDPFFNVNTPDDLAVARAAEAGG